MSRILVANPPTERHPGRFFRPVRFPTYQYATPVMHPPLYLLSAATALRDLGGHAVSFVDAQAPGLTVAAFLRRAQALRPELAVLETCLASFSGDVAVAAALRRTTGCRVILCGPQLGMPEIARAMLAHPDVDALVLGEYEMSLLELVASGLAAGVPGTAVRGAGGEAVLGPKRPRLRELDLLPDPDQRWLDHAAYYDPLLRNPFAFFLSARGCPHGCVFCSWPQTFSGRAHRTRSPRRVAEDIARTLAAAPRLRSFLFNDDTFTVERRHCLAVCEELRACGVRTPWGCYTRADFDDLEVLRALRSAGCRLLKVGVESSDAGVQLQAGKRCDIPRARRAIALMKELGFRVHATFAFGLPGETRATIAASVRWVCAVDPHSVQFSAAVPYPGTAFHDYLARGGHLLPHSWDDLTPLRPVYRYPDLAPDELARAVPAAYRRFYLRPRAVARLLARLAAEPGRIPGLVSRSARLLADRGRA
ncbi:MAG TPA: radical SAM protein [bacterium]